MKRRQTGMTNDTPADTAAATRYDRNDMVCICPAEWVCEAEEPVNGCEWTMRTPSTSCICAKKVMVHQYHENSTANAAAAIRIFRLPLTIRLQSYENSQKKELLRVPFPTAKHKLFRIFLIVALCVTAHKLIHTTGGVYQLHLTCVERVRRVGNFHLIHGIGFAVHLDGLFCRNGGPAQKHVVIRHILECHQTIILRMNSLFHLSCVF